MLYDWSMDSNCSTSLGSKNLVVCARVGGANTTPLFLAAHFAKKNTKFGGGGKRGRAKIPSPQPPSFLPACWNPPADFSSGGAERKERIVALAPPFPCARNKWELPFIWTSILKFVIIVIDES